MMHNRLTNLKPVLLLMALLLLLSACAAKQTAQPDQPQADNWKLIAYNFLAESKVAYDKAFTGLALADQLGKLKPADKALAIKYGRLYRDAHNAAVNMLLNNQQPNLAAVRSALALIESIALPYLTRSLSWTPFLLPCSPSWV